MIIELHPALVLDRTQLTAPDFPVNWEQHKAKYYTPTTPEFMAVLDEIEFSQFMRSIPRVWCLPEPKPVTRWKTLNPLMDQPQPLAATVRTWLEHRQDYTRASFEAGKIDKKRATADDIRDVCTAIRKMGGDHYSTLLDKLNCIRTLERNSDEKLVTMLQTLNRQLWALYNKAVN